MSFTSSVRLAMALFVLLMTWASFAAGTNGAYHDIETANMQPCPFNQLCRCSRGGPEVGLVYCEDIPLGDVPNAINNTKSFAINLRRNGLRRIEEDLFHRTGNRADLTSFPPHHSLHSFWIFTVGSRTGSNWIQTQKQS